MAISQDARWLAAASADTSLRVWDLPTARCIEWLEFPSCVTGLSFSPSGEFLATCFADSVGITLWASKPFFGAARPDAIARKPIRMQTPHAAVADEEQQPSQSQLEQADADEQDEDAADALPESRAGPAVARFGGGDTSKWFALANLELIKQRNKPIEPPSKPEKAPFFLPTSQAVNPVFVAPNAAASATGPAEREPALRLAHAGEWSDEDEDEQDKVNAGGRQLEHFPSRLLHAGGAAGGNLLARPRSKLMAALEEAHAEHEVRGARTAEAFTDAVQLLKAMTPSAVDFELRNVSLGFVEDDDGAKLLAVILDWLLAELRGRTNLEVAQAVLSRVLALHAETLAARPELQARLRPLQLAQDQAWKQLRARMQHSLCLLAFFSNQR
jgi:U3 small nucleolar RNA-associated protein 21